VFDASSEPMRPTHAVKKGTRYRYYIFRRLITGSASDSSRGQRVPASNLEALVIGRLRALMADPVEVLNAISNGERDAPMQNRVRAAALSARWERLPTERDLAGAVTLRYDESEVSAPRELSGRCDRGLPRAHGSSAKHAVRLGRSQMALDVEGVVNGGMN
jgi:hypothetical protein